MERINRLHHIIKIIYHFEIIPEVKHTNDFKRPLGISIKYRCISKTIKCRQLLAPLHIDDFNHQLLLTKPLTSEPLTQKRTNRTFLPYRLI